MGAGPRGETFARAARRTGANIEDLRTFLTALKTRYGHLPVYYDQEECVPKFHMAQLEAGHADRRGRSGTESSDWSC